MNVSVVYALPDRQIVREVEIPAGASVAMAVEQSGLLQEFPEISLNDDSVGIYGLVTRPNAALQPGDRVEIYRKLLLEPKDARRQRLKTR